jgi:rod shape-determining protein MreC
MLFTWFMLTGFILLLSPEGFTSRFQFAFARIFHWPLSLGRNIPLAARTRLPVQDETSSKEAQYQNYIANIQEELQQKQREIETLSGLRSRLHGLEGAKLVLADIITGSTEGQRCELIINRGQNDFLAKGQFVLGDNSIIGAISEAGPRTAKVRMLTDAGCATAVRIQGLDVDMLLQGSGNNSARIKLVPIKHKVRQGDVVLAAKKPGLIDTPMIAGKVSECKRDDKNPAVWDITVKPVCDLANLSSVAVIVMNPQTPGPGVP